MATILAKIYEQGGLGEDFEPYVRLLPDVVANLMEEVGEDDGKLFRRGLVGAATVAGFMTMPLAGVAAGLFGVMMENGAKNQRDQERELDRALAEANFCDRYRDDLATLLNATAAVCGWVTMWTSYEATLRHIVIEDDDRLAGKAYENASVSFCSTIIEGTDMFLRMVKVGIPAQYWPLVLQEMQNERAGMPYRTYEQIKHDEVHTYLNTHQINAAPIQAELVEAPTRPALPAHPARSPALYSGKRQVEVIGLPAAVPPKAPQLPPATSPIITPPPAAPAAAVVAVDAQARADIERLRMEIELERQKAERIKLELEQRQQAKPLEPTPAPAPNPIITPAPAAPAAPPAPVEETGGGFPDLGTRPNVAPQPPAPWMPNFGINGAGAIPRPVQPSMGDSPLFGGVRSSELAPEIAELLEESEADPVDLVAELENTVFSGGEGSGKSTLVDHAIRKMRQKYPNLWIGVIDGKTSMRYNEADALLRICPVPLLERKGDNLMNVRPVHTAKFESNFLPALYDVKRPTLLVIDEPIASFLGLEKTTVDQLTSILRNPSGSKAHQVYVWVVSFRHAASDLGMNPEALADYKKVFVAQASKPDPVALAKSRGFIGVSLPEEARSPVCLNNRYVCINNRWQALPFLSESGDPRLYYASSLYEEDAKAHVREALEQRSALKASPMAPEAAPVGLPSVIPSTPAPVEISPTPVEAPKEMNDYDLLDEVIEWLEERRDNAQWQQFTRRTFQRSGPAKLRSDAATRERVLDLAVEKGYLAVVEMDEDGKRVKKLTLAD